MLDEATSTPHTPTDPGSALPKAVRRGRTGVPGTAAACTHARTSQRGPALPHKPEGRTWACCRKTNQGKSRKSISWISRVQLCRGLSRMRAHGSALPVAKGRAPPAAGRFQPARARWGLPTGNEVSAGGRLRRGGWILSQPASAAAINGSPKARRKAVCRTGRAGPLPRARGHPKRGEGATHVTCGGG